MTADRDWRRESYRRQPDIMDAVDRHFPVLMQMSAYDKPNPRAFDQLQ
jgi:hypothetical protein